MKIEIYIIKESFKCNKGIFMKGRNQGSLITEGGKEGLRMETEVMWTKAKEFYQLPQVKISKG